MSTKRLTCGAFVLAGCVAFGIGAAAAQTPQAPAGGAASTPPAPGSALYGRPETEGAARLAPIAPPPIPTAADRLPIGKLKVPQGFKIEVFASGVANARCGSATRGRSSSARG